jgi:hypothetical protein
LRANQQSLSGIIAPGTVAVVVMEVVLICVKLAVLTTVLATVKIPSLLVGHGHFENAIVLVTGHFFLFAVLCA